MQNNDFRYLTLDEVVEGQELQLKLYGGGDPGVLNNNSLQSAVDGPQQAWYAETAFHVATAYLDKMVNGHPFSNGNKRAGLGSALEFLHLNGLRVETSNEELTALVLSMFGSDRVTTDGIIEFLQRTSMRFEDSQTDPAVRIANARSWMHAQYAQTFAVLAQ